MTNKATGLIGAARKPGKYVTDIEELKSEIKEADVQKTTANNQNREQQPTKPPQEEKVITPKAAVQPIVGLHIPIPQDLRDQLKVKAINDGKKMKDAVVSLIEGYVSN